MDRRRKSGVPFHLTRRDQIAVLLHHYRVVCEGIPGIEEPDDEDMLALMCEEWNHPSYQQLERLLRVMGERWPELRGTLRQRYERYSERQAAWCRRCGEHPVSHVGRYHAHPPGRSVPRCPRIVRWDVADPSRISQALEWLRRNRRRNAAG